MEDKLKHFIDTHRAAFDDEQMPEGHFDRFEAKLPGRNRHLKVYGLVTFAAAACALFLLIHTGVFDMNGNGDTSPFVCEMRQEVDEVKLFYHMQMNDIITQMEDIYAENQVPGAADLLKETKKIQLESRTFEKEVLPTLPCTSDGLFAINQYYGNSLESMRQMLGYLTQLTGQPTHY